MTTPSLYLHATTEVVVTSGDWVWEMGVPDWNAELSYGPYTSLRGYAYCQRFETRFGEESTNSSPRLWKVVHRFRKLLVVG